MYRINLSGRLSFVIEQQGKHLRLIVFSGDEELVCHKTDRAEFKQFILSEKSHLFKGRLQLDKTGDSISIRVKGKTAGIIGLPEFEKLVD